MARSRHFLNLGSAHIGGKHLLDELLQRLRLLLFRDGAYDGVTHDIAAAVDQMCIRDRSMSTYISELYSDESSNMVFATIRNPLFR